MTWGWVNDPINIFGWTIYPFKFSDKSHLCIETVLRSAGMETLPSNLMLSSEEIIFSLTGLQPSQKGQKEFSHASSSFSFDSLKP